MMVVRGGRTSLARSRMIRSAIRSRRSRVLNCSSKNTSSRLSNSSKTQSTSETQQTKKLAMYEEVQKAADDLQKTANALLELGKLVTTMTETTDKTATEETDKSATADSTTAENGNTTTGDSNKPVATENTTATSSATENTKSEEQQKKEIIAAVKDLVEQYNLIYEKLEDIGGSVNTLFASQLKNLLGNSEEALKKTGVSLNRNGTLSITTKTLENTDLSTLKDVYCNNKGLTSKLMEKCEYIESNAATTIDVMNRMYGTQTYNKYGTSSSYYGSTGSWYNAIG